MRVRLGLMSLMIVAAACGGGDGAPDNDVSPTTQSTTTAAPTTEPGDAGTTRAPAGSVAGPPAPDFTTMLADGSEFNLASHGRPVYLVFWAEW